VATKRSTPSKRTTSSGSRPKSRGTADRALIDDRSRRDLYGVALSVLAVAMMIAVLSARSGVAAEYSATALRTIFGVGAVILPVALLAWGLSFFVRGTEIREARTALGLAIVFVALISMAGLTTPAGDYFDPLLVLTHGGYVGGAVAWALESLVGEAIAWVLVSGLLITGLVVTGLSISGLVDRIRELVLPEQVAEPKRRSIVERAPKTQPLRTLDAEDLSPASAVPAVPRKRRDGVAGDPEAARKTVPVAASAPPRRLEGFVLPPYAILNRTSESASRHRASDKELQATASVIEDALATFDIPSRVVGWVPGPTITLFEVDIAKGVRLNRITALADDLALSLAASTVRILAPIPGKSLVGIEVPNERRSMVTLGDVLTAQGEGGPLYLGIGKDVSGDRIVSDLATMPHLLIAGSTGTGKSVAINAMLMSILMRATPAEVRLILIDPKRVELSLYNGVPHLYVPVVTEPKEAASALAWAVQEMDRRLKQLQAGGARNIGMYNAMVRDGKGPEGAEEMPYIVIVIDELADLMMIAAKEVEDSICRIAQLARAAGIHLIIATQRPSTNVITGLIKANVTNRIAFAVASGIDSRVILDQSGAEKLIGMGDMLYTTPAFPKPKRIQGAFVAEDEILAAVAALKAQGEPDYHEEILQVRVTTTNGGGGGGEGLDDDDPLLWEAADIIVTSTIGSTSMLQRRLKVGYARAGRIMDMLEAKGVVGPPTGSKAREVLVDIEELESLKAFERLDSLEAGE